MSIVAFPTAGIESDALTDFSDMLPTFVGPGQGTVARILTPMDHPLLMLLLKARPSRDTQRNGLWSMRILCC